MNKTIGIISITAGLSLFSSLPVMSVDTIAEYQISVSGENPLQERLNQLTFDLNEYQGKEFRFEVFQESDIYSEASPDGLIRVSSGMMEAMNSNELLGIITHQMGHVYFEDATASSANPYAHEQEYSADEFGFLLCVEKEIEPYAIALALEKLLALQKDPKTASKVKMMLSSHPDTEERMLRVRLLAEQNTKQ